MAKSKINKYFEDEVEEEVQTSKEELDELILKDLEEHKDMLEEIVHKDLEEHKEELERIEKGLEEADKDTPTDKDFKINPLMIEKRNRRISLLITKTLFKQLKEVKPKKQAMNDFLNDILEEYVELKKAQK